MCNKRCAYSTTCLCLSALAGLTLPLVTSAQTINEIVYSPSTKSWVEIFNNTGSDIDLSQYKILDAGAATNGHAISAAQTGGSTILPSGAYGVVAKDLTAISASYVFKASLGIKTSGDTISLKKGTSIIDTASFTDTASGGNSLQRFDAGWSLSVPTPGGINVMTFTDVGSDASSTSTTDTTTPGTTPAAFSGYSAHYYFVPAQNDTSTSFKASIGRDRLVSIGDAVLFQAALTTNDLNTSYFWNFGDGSTGEGKEIRHIYLIAGDYNVVLNAALFDNRAVSRTRVKVVDPQVYITERAPEYIAVKNSGKYEINLYGWKIVDASSSFSFPMDTLIGAGDTVRFPKSITRVGADAILMRQGEITKVTTPTVSASSIATSTPDAVRIQALADELVALNQELRNIQKPLTTSKDDAASSVLVGEQTAAVMQSLSEEPVRITSTSWVETLKHFFGLK